MTHYQLCRCSTVFGIVMYLIVTIKMLFVLFAEGLEAIPLSLVILHWGLFFGTINLFGQTIKAKQREEKGQ